ncbi:hypothetical protein HYT33_04535 [Candidatus Roizmanbacteria bacterium]|nr:hypothetical protein [Candidatus Roizmanbacteria bacterium]
MKDIVLAGKTILSKKDYLIIFLSFIPLIFLFFVMVQIWTIPGNNIRLQLSIFKTRDYILTVLLSFLVSLFLVMQAFIFRNAYSAKTKLASVGVGGATGYLGMGAAVLATATCAACLIALFGFLGFGSIVFLLKNQWWVVSVAIILLLVSLYFSSRKVNGLCESCKVHRKPLK